MHVEEPRGHAETVRGLWRAAARGRLPHACLFEGPAGIGKFLSAQWLAQGLLCVQGPGAPCGTCGPCRRVLSGGETSNHPDFLRIDPVLEGTETIKLARIAERDGGGESAESFLRLRALEGGWRVVLVREAERMQVAAQNALLKTLEEPSAHTLIVLECSRSEALLPTIRSRCVRVRFEPLAADDARAVIAAHGLAGGLAGGPEAADAERLARWSGGSPGAALRLASEGALALRPLLAAVLAGEREPLAASRALWELPGSFAGETPSAQARARARAALDLALRLVRDRMAAALGAAPDTLRHGDLETAAPAAQGPAGAALLESLLAAREDVDRNLAPEAVLDRALLRMAPTTLQPSR